MNVVETLSRYWPAFLITFAVVVALCVYLGTDSESRTHRRWKRAIRKYGVLAVATAFAFAGSVAIGAFVGTIGSTDVGESSITPLHLVLGFLIVLASAVLVGLTVTACVRFGRSRRAHA